MSIKNILDQTGTRYLIKKFLSMLSTKTETVELTQAEYDALDNSKLTDGKVYCITDETDDATDSGSSTSGDMKKEIYDPDNDGKVSNAETADNALSLAGVIASNYLRVVSFDSDTGTLTITYGEAMDGNGVKY